MKNLNNDTYYLCILGISKILATALNICTKIMYYKQTVEQNEHVTMETIQKKNPVGCMDRCLLLRETDKH